MTSKIMLIFAAAILLAVVLVINFVLMTGDLPLAEIATTLVHGEAETYEQSVLLYQQIPRSLIAIYVGATTAVSGCVLQGLARNPLASPSTTGLNAGATLLWSPVRWCSISRPKYRGSSRLSAPASALAPASSLPGWPGGQTIRAACRSSCPVRLSPCC